MRTVAGVPAAGAREQMVNEAPMVPDLERLEEIVAYETSISAE